jgi:MoaA/NifB/PqqE/SkfB family radical SAM enzyme
MYSSSKKNTFLGEETFRKIIGKYPEEDFELQLEGGEPLEHPKLLEFLEWAAASDRLRKVIIDTNGLKLDQNHLESLAEFARHNHTPVVIKVSINYWLRRLDPQIFERATELLTKANELSKVQVHFNVRLRKDVDESLRDDVVRYGLSDASNVFYLQSYGLMTGSDGYEQPVIVQNIDDWYIYASDGTEFHSADRAQDLIDRSEYERRLP